MGLKTENYVSKSLGVHLPIAYAVLKNLIIESDNSARAIFAVQTNRENASKFTAIDKVEVRFKWDRKTDPAKMAYEAAKTDKREYEEYHPEMNTSIAKTEYGMLYGWTDDIV